MTTSHTRRSPWRRRAAAPPPQRILCEYLTEPLLAFADEQLHVDPKAGIARYGPRSYGRGEHPASVRVGLIGTAETIATARAWLQTNAEGVLGDEKNPEFPGYQRDRGFCSELTFDDASNETITQTELQDLLRERRPQKDRFEATVALLDEKLRLLGDRDHPPQYVVIGLPNELVRQCRVAEYHDPQLGMVHRDLRRAIKATAMKYRIPTQLMRQQTMEGKDRTPPAKIAWNFFTGLYFKAGGCPWGRRGRTAQPLEAVADPVDGDPSPEVLVLAAEERASVRRLLAGLPSDQRRVIELRLAGLTGAEIAAVLGRSLGSVKMLQFRAVARLRDRPAIGTAVTEGHDDTH